MASSGVEFWGSVFVVADFVVSLLVKVEKIFQQNATN